MTDATHDTFGNKLPVTFEGVTGMFARKLHTPTGDEVRVTAFDHGHQAMQHTFKDLDTARPFMNAANADRHGSDRKVVLEFGDDTKMTLRFGKTY